jgi:hypothetical protein
MHGHCNVLYNCSLGYWVAKQRKIYELHLEGKTSTTTSSRIQELDSLGFEWDIYGTVWKERLSELTDYRRIQGHCNVPHRYRKT